MQRYNQLKIVAFGILIVSAFFTHIVTVVYSQDLSSDNYTILSPEVTFGGFGDGTNYDLRGLVGDALSSTHFASTNYYLDSNQHSTFQANVPEVTCFETSTTDADSLCNSAYPNTYGAQGECGSPGCYDRAKFVIDDQNNPVDTKYLVLLSPDNWVTTYYVNPSTLRLQTTYAITDFKTKCYWEGTLDSNVSECLTADSDRQSMNVRGLVRGTTYKIKFIAMHGDFTESGAGPEASATTLSPSITFDLNIGGGVTMPTTSAPYIVDFGDISYLSVTTVSDKIWVDISSNANNGIEVRVRDKYAGLLNQTSSEVIASVTADLSSTDNGYGLQVDSTNMTQGAHSPSSLDDTSCIYSVGGNQVGAVSTAAQCVFDSNGGPILSGVGPIKLKAKSSVKTTAGALVDELTFIAIGYF